MKKARKWIINITLIVYAIFGYIVLFRRFGFTDLSYRVTIYAAGAGFAISGLALLFNLEVVKRDFIRAGVVLLSTTIGMPGWFITTVRIETSRLGSLIMITILISVAVMGAYKLFKHRHEIRELLMPADAKKDKQTNHKI